MKYKIKFAGKDVDADLIEVSQSNEKWNEYLLDDGTVLKMKLVLKKVLRATDTYDPDGNPIYVAESQNILTVNPPGNLRRK